MRWRQIFLSPQIGIYHPYGLPRTLRWFLDFIYQGLRLNGEDIRRLSDFCYLGSVVAEGGGASTNVNVRIQKARGSFFKLRKVRLATSIRKDTKIRIVNAWVKSVLLYGCETWLVKVKSDVKYKLLLI
jgi:hypothetical protein